jgi:hypothetical protein
VLFQDSQNLGSQGSLDMYTWCTVELRRESQRVGMAVLHSGSRPQTPDHSREPGCPRVS